MNGLEFFSWLKRESPVHVDRVMFMTGDVMNEGLWGQLQQSGRPHLSKPFSRSQLMAMVHTVLEPSEVGDLVSPLGRI